MRVIRCRGKQWRHTYKKRILTAVRKKTKAELKTRVYTKPGSNYCWHIDGYDKIKPDGFAIHGRLQPQGNMVMHLSMLSPRGGGVGQGVGILTFSIKKSQIPHPRDKIIGQNPDPGQVKVVKCHSNLVAHKRNFPTVGMTYDQNPYPGGITYDQNPYPGDSAHDQNPVVSPTPPPPLGLNIDRCIRIG